MELSKQTYKKQGNISLFDSEDTMDKLNSLGNPLEKLSRVVDFEMFRKELEAGLYKEKFTNVGAKPYDYVLMFKILVLQRMYHLSDEQTEYQIRDRLSFRDFVGLASGDKVPDARTVWVFRNELASKGLVEKLFKRFYKFLEDNHMILNEGMIIDGSFVEVPRQRNSREENKLIREDEGDKLWNEEMGDTEEDKKRKANKKRHKDTDARWTKKGGNTYYGYKSHAKVDAKSELIKKCVATNASVHDSKPTCALVDKSDQGQELYADSAYIGKGVKRVLRKYGLKDRIIKRNVRGKKISKGQDTINRKNAKVRTRVEHVFGIMEGCLHGMRSRAVGFLRNEAYIIFSGLVYNLIRYEQIKRLGMN